MKKNLFILAALLLPASLCAQSALGQLEHIAGQSIHDVYVPPVPDPTPVDVEEEEEDSQPQQSTHLKDYTPAQETTQPAPEPKPKTFEELQQEWAENERKRREEEWRRQTETENAYWEGEEKERESAWRWYNSFLKDQPRVEPVPVFSGIDERKYVFDKTQSPQELRDFGKFYLEPKDSTYKVDMIRCSNAPAGTRAYYLGRRLENGRTEWRIFIHDRVSYGTYGYAERYAKLGFPKDFDYRQIRDVDFKGEGRVTLLKMADGSTYVLKPDGSVLCRGRNLSFPVISYEAWEGTLYIECDGKLYTSCAPRYAGPLLEGDNFEYYGRTVIVTKHDSNGKYYTMSNYGGRSFDYKENAWKVKGDHVALDYIGSFSNDGDYYVLQPRGKKHYIIVSYLRGRLYKGKGTYKSLEAAHKAWPKEQKYRAHIYFDKPDKRTKNE